MSYEHSQIRQPLYDGVRPVKNDGVHILIAHGGDESHCPLNTAALAGAGFDYIALGHFHTPQNVIRDVAAYSGALEPIESNDLGAHGYIEGRIENGKVKTRFVPFSIRTYSQLLLNVNEESTQLSIEEALKDEIFKKGGTEYISCNSSREKKTRAFSDSGKTEILWKYYRSTG